MKLGEIVFGTLEMEGMAKKPPKSIEEAISWLTRYIVVRTDPVGLVALEGGRDSEGRAFIFEFVAGMYFGTPLEAISASAAHEREYGEKCIRNAEVVERLIARSEGNA